MRRCNIVSVSCLYQMSGRQGRRTLAIGLAKGLRMDGRLREPSQCASLLWEG